jgi:hypothetical protein
MKLVRYEVSKLFSQSVSQPVQQESSFLLVLPLTLFLVLSQISLSEFLGISCFSTISDLIH